jgi:hypothetical protein
MSVTAHRAMDPVDVAEQVAVPVRHAEVVPLQRARRAPHRAGPPTRRRVASAPRVLDSGRCAPRAARLPGVTLLAVGAAMFVAVVGIGMLASAGAGDVPEETAVVRVMPGESLWDVAERVAPGSDVGAVVARIQEINGLDGALRPGQPLTVPVG